MDHRPLTLTSHGRVQVRGFTAVELMVTIAILGILAARAAPSFTSLIERWRVRTVTEAMQSTIYLARSEAMRRGGAIVVRKNPNVSGVCTLAGTNEEWGCGWTVFFDADRNNVFDGSDIKLQEYSGGSRVNVVHKSGGEFFTVDRNGVIGSLNAKGFILTPQDGSLSSPAATGICATSGGRIKVISDPPCSKF